MSESKPSFKQIMESLIEMQRDGIDVSDPTIRTPVLAAVSLRIAQAHLLELAKAEGQGGDADKAFEHVQKAVDLLHLDTRQLKEH